MDIHVAGSYASLADDWAGIKIIDISDPSSPRVVGELDTPGNAERITVSGNLAFVADGEAGMRVVDVSHPDAPQEISAHDTSGYTWDVRISGDRAYVADGDQGLRIIDVSDPSAATEIGHCLPTGQRVDVRGVDVAGSHAYLAAGSPGLIVVDISDPKDPRKMGQIDVGRTARTVRVSGSYAFVGLLNWLKVIDVSEPSSLREVASYKAPAQVTATQIDDSTVYVAARQAGLMILGTQAQPPAEPAVAAVMR